MFSKRYILFYFIFLGLLKKSLCQSNPCPSNFQYYKDGYRTIGLVRLTNFPSTSVRLSVKLSIGASLSSSYIGEIKPVSTNIDNEYQRTGAVIFKVFFPMDNPLPHVMSIVVNGAMVCSGYTAVGSYVTTVTLEYSFYLSKITFTTTTTQNPINYHDVFLQNNNQNHITTTPKSTQNKVQNFNEDDIDDTVETISHKEEIDGLSKKRKINQVCGMPDKPVGLILHGLKTRRGDFPWHAAIFKKTDDGIMFICGGSLVSDQHVLTAAHCINGGFVTDREKQKYLVMLGKYKLNKYNEERSVVMEVNDIRIHSEYTAPQPDADLAVIELEKPVRFSPFIRPVCLYTRSMPKNINGNEATVVGWGRDENGRTSNELKELKIKVVDSETCRNSHIRYESIVTDGTFCAEGVLKGSSACNGDSGGGVVIKNNNRWYLRGVVSVSLAVNSTYVFCNPDFYFVLADTQKYYTWIENNVFDD